MKLLPNIDFLPSSKGRLFWLLFILFITSLILIFAVRYQNYAENQMKKNYLANILLLNQGSTSATITNKARVVYQDNTGKNYGPVYSNEVSITKPTAPTVKIQIQYKKSAGNTYPPAAVLKIFNLSKQKMKEISLSIDQNGNSDQFDAPAEMSAGTPYDLVLKVPYALTKKKRINSWPPSQKIDFGEVIIGNLNDNDDIIDSLDWSVMNSKWRTKDATADINRDGIVNTLDWSLVNKNWHQKGEE